MTMTTLQYFTESPIVDQIVSLISNWNFWNFRHEMKVPLQIAEKKLFSQDQH